MKYLAYLLTVCLFFGSPVVMADAEGDAPKSAAEARMEKKDEAKDNLAKAIALDPSLAKRAANDAEFSDYNM